MVIGCPGGGKSTFARALHEKTGLPLIYLDRLNWNADRTTVSREVFRRRLEEAVAEERWIIDGNYGSTLELRLRRCDTVFFLDYPVEICLAGALARVGVGRADMPWVEEEPDQEFLRFIRDFPANGRPKILALLERYPDKKVVVFRSRREAEDFLR